jgi:hypothetical protein
MEIFEEKGWNTRLVEAGCSKLGDVVTENDDLFTGIFAHRHLIVNFQTTLKV